MTSNRPYINCDKVALSHYDYDKVHVCANAVQEKGTYIHCHSAPHTRNVVT